MKIETKYNVGDRVWFEDDGNIHNGKIDIINIDVHEHHSPNILIQYHVDEPNGISETLHESVLFPSKEELKNKLLK